MKLRNGFVSNSSSASFIIRFKSSLPQERIERLVRGCSDWLDMHWESETKHTVLIGKKFEMTTSAQRLRLTRKRRVYSLAASTVIFNDWKDIDVWPLARMLSEVSPALTGLELVEILQTEDECDTIEKRAEFSMDLCVVDEKDSDRQRAQAEREYLEYLHAVGVGLTQEQTVALAEHQLLG